MTCTHVVSHKSGAGDGNGVGRNPVVFPQHRNQLQLATWVWVDSGSWSWTGRPGVLWFMGSQRVGRD